MCKWTTVVLHSSIHMQLELGHVIKRPNITDTRMNLIITLILHEALRTQTLHSGQFSEVCTTRVGKTFVTGISLAHKGILGNTSLLPRSVITSTIFSSGH